MKNKGQITIFIILAIIIVIGIISYFSLNNNFKTMRNSEINNINSFVKDCIKSTAKNAIYQIGQNGGYYLPTKISTTNGIPYYYYNKENLMPSISKIEDELELYINNNLEDCTASFETFPDFKIKSGKVNSKIIINGNINVNVKYPLNIAKNEKTYLLENFENIDIVTRIDVIYKSIKELIRDQLTRKNICLSCITNIALENDLIINIIKTEEETLFVIQEKNYEINEIPIKWQFANKY